MKLRCKAGLIDGLDSLGGHVIAEVALEVQTQIVAEVQNFAHSLVGNGQAVLKTVGGGGDFLFAVGVDALLTFGLGGLTQLLQILGEVSLDGFGIAEDGG